MSISKSLSRTLGSGLSAPGATGGGAPPAPSNLIVNGGFDSGASWTAGGGWSIGSGIASHTAGVSSNLSQTLALDGAKLYRFKATVAGRSAGGVHVRCDGGTTVDGYPLLVNGTGQTWVFPHSAGNTTFVARASSDFNGNIDDLELFEYTLGAVDTGSLVSNGAFASGDDWAIREGFTISGGKLVNDGVEVVGICVQPRAITNAVTYRVEFTLSDITGGTWGGATVVFLGPTGAQQIGTLQEGAGAKSFTIVATADYPMVGIRRTSDFRGSVSAFKISVEP